MTFAFFGGAPGGGELLLILVVLLLLFGSKNLPKIARTLGRTLEEFRRATHEVTREIMHADETAPEPPRKLKGAAAREPPPPPELPAEQEPPAHEDSGHESA